MSWRYKKIRDELKRRRDKVRTKEWVLNDGVPLANCSRNWGAEDKLPVSFVGYEVKCEGCFSCSIRKGDDSKNVPLDQKKVFCKS